MRALGLSLILLASGSAGAEACTIALSTPQQLEREEQRELDRLVRRSETIYEGVIAKPVPLTVRRAKFLKGSRAPRVIQPPPKSGPCGERFSVAYGGARVGDRVLVLGRPKGLFGFAAHDVVFRSSRYGADILRRIPSKD